MSRFASTCGRWSVVGGALFLGLLAVWFGRPDPEVVSRSSGLPSRPPAPPGTYRADNRADPARSPRLTRVVAGAVAGGVPRHVSDAGFLARVSAARVGEPLEMRLADGLTVRGWIESVRRAGAPGVAVAGRVLAPEAGRFFVQIQSLPGVLGDAFGVVELAESGRAFRLEPGGPEGHADWVEHPLAEIRCVGLPQPEAGEPAGSVGLASTRTQASSGPLPRDARGLPLFESLPGPHPVIYLDFHGGTTTTWGGVTFGAPAYDDENIEEIWARVAEDFRPFRLNVVTDERAYARAAANGRQRVIITPTDQASPGAGGVAYVGTFNSTEDIPCWVFVTNNARQCAQAVSHETGHTLGLSHAGLRQDSGYTEYYPGHGVGETGWAPIMGLPYYRNVTQWSRGEYAEANNLQDQLRILTSQNKVAWRADDAPESGLGIRPLELFEDGRCDTEGIIERTGDVDAFVFVTDGGMVSLTAAPGEPGPNLALDLALDDIAARRLAVAQPEGTLSASLATNLPAGTYVLRVTGAGRGDPATDGFSAYASLGRYRITGHVPQTVVPDRWVVPENSPPGTLVGRLVPRRPHRIPPRYLLTGGATNGVFALDSDGALRVATTNVLDYEALVAASNGVARLELSVALLDDEEPAASETNRRVVIVVSDVPEPPTLPRFRTGVSVSSCFGENCEFSLSVLEHAALGTVIGTALGDDPDRFANLVYSLAGNTDGRFEIGAESGELRVAGDLQASLRNRYDFGIIVADGTQVGSLSVTSKVHVSVELPLGRGSLLAAVYPDIPGTTLASLTDAPGFPLEPASEIPLVGIDYPSGAFGFLQEISVVGEGGSVIFSGLGAVAFGTEIAEIPGSLDWGATLPGFRVWPGEGGFLNWPWQGDLPTNHFGAVIRGYLLPPVTGDYTFWIACQDNGELWLSDSTNAAAMSRIASVTGEGVSTAPQEWTKYPSQQSPRMPLRAGWAYAIEARLKTDVGRGHLAVAWECADGGISLGVVPGKYLAPRSINYQPRVAGFEAVVRRNAFPGARLGTLATSDLNAGDHVRYALVDGDQEGLFTIDENSGTVRVGTARPLGAAQRSDYTLGVRATDDGDPVLSGSGTVHLTLLSEDAPGSSTLLHEVWPGVTNGASIQALQEDERYPARPEVLRPFGDLAFDGGGDGTGWGSRSRAYLVPPTTGLYSFFLASEGAAQLKIAYDGGPETAAIVSWLEGGAGPRQWTKTSSQQSAARWLVAGQRYYLEVLARAGGASGRFEVGWIGPGLTGTNVVPGAVLGSVDLGYPPTLTSNLVNLAMTATNGTLVAELTARDSPLETLTYRIVGGDPEGHFRIDLDSGRITLASPVALSGAGESTAVLAVEVQDSGYSGRFPLRSANATVTVRVIDTTLASSWVGRGDDGYWSTPANWSTGEPKEGGRLTFGGLFQRTNHNDLLRRAGFVRFNAGGFFVKGNPLILTEGLLSNGENTWAVDCALAGHQGFTNISRTLTWRANLHNQGHDLTLDVGMAMRLEGELHGTGGLIKTGPGDLWVTATNPYSGRTVIQSGRCVVADRGSLVHSTNVVISVDGVLDVHAAAAGFEIAPGQVLSGVGRIVGDVRIRGVLAPDPPPGAGGLSFSNSLSLEGELVLPLRRISGSSTAVPLRVAGELRCGGVLTVHSQELNPSLAPGDTFSLVHASRTIGAFDRMDLPKLPNGLVWDTGQLPVDGTIRIAPAPPTVLPPSMVGSALSVQFQTVRGLTYVVETTDALRPDATWTPTATRTGSGSVTTVLVPRTPDASPRFFRVRLVP